MQTVTRDTTHLSRLLIERFPQFRVAAVDGWTGVGKTALAYKLAHQLGCAFYDLDADANAPGVTEFMTPERLAKARKNLQTHSAPTIVSGVLIRSFLASIDIEIDANIYVKRISPWGWTDEDQTNSLAYINSFGTPSRLTLEIFEYHQKFMPHRNADFIFERPA